MSIPPLTADELVPATTLVKNLGNKFRKTDAVKEALHVVHQHIVDHHMRNDEGHLLIPNDWKSEKGEKIVGFLASFSELAHIAVESSQAVAKKEGVSDMAAIELKGKEAIRKIDTAMQVMTEYLDRGVSPEQLKEVFKGYHEGAGSDGALDPTRLKLMNSKGYLHFPELEMARSNSEFKKGGEKETVTLLDLVESASLTVDQHLKPTSHAQRASLKSGADLQH